MNRRLATLLLSALALWMSASAHADRDIVYAARYYSPPGSHRTSHFHLYRINPDGTRRTQLTYGDEDDTDPHWSPGGRHIAFMRSGNTVCVTASDGSDFREIAAFKANDFVADLGWLHDGRTLAFIHGKDEPKSYLTSLWLMGVNSHYVRRWASVSDYAASPDGHRLFLDDSAGPCLLSLADHAVVHVSNDVVGLKWLGEQHLVGVVEGPSDSVPVAVRLVDLDGQGGKVLRLKYPKAGAWAVDPLDDDGWLLPSPQPNTVVWALNEHNSTVGALAAFFEIHLSDGAMCYLAQGQFLAWSPGGNRFCTAPGRDTWTYKERKWDGTYRTVWAAPLEVGILGGKLRTITPGLVWVTGAD